MFYPDPVRQCAQGDGVDAIEVRNWELRVFVFRWGWLSELEESFSRAGEPMTWQGKPELLLCQHQEGVKKGVWTVPTIFERDEEGERERPWCWVY